MHEEIVKLVQNAGESVELVVLPKFSGIVKTRRLMSMLKDINTPADIKVLMLHNQP